jgi:5'-nucleotidase (lipoprotein e(P4) family)
VNISPLPFRSKGGTRLPLRAGDGGERPALPASPTPTLAQGRVPLRDLKGRGLICVTAALLVAGCAAMPPPASTSVPPADPPATMQYLYGSGEAAALSQQAFAALLDHVRAVVKARPKDSVVLAAGSDLGSRTFVPCGDKPFAVVFDVDETLLLNLGFEYFDATTGKGYDAAAWDRWEKTGADSVVAVPGAAYALDALRGLDVTVVFNSNRSAANAQATADAIRSGHLGPAVHGETLFLKGDDASGSAKDGRRATIAAKYCVIAMGGDQLGDFSDLFNSEASMPRRRELAREAASQMWGRGWFMLPNPVYGTALKGGFDDIFPLDKRWPVPAPKEK